MGKQIFIIDSRIKEIEFIPGYGRDGFPSGWIRLWMMGRDEIIIGFETLEKLYQMYKKRKR